MADATGHQLGRYTIHETLGRGGMGTVYRARTRDGQEVAIKIINPTLTIDETNKRRFAREAQAMAKLAHRNIVQILDYNEQDGISYLVMKLVRGGTMEDVIKNGPLALDDVSRFLNQITEALHYAHNQGVIHRDLKPANILLDEGGNVILTDFGIAKLFDATKGLTRPDDPIGTPAYMSPEQCKGKPVDEAADVYALGVILFEMLTGRLPFDAPDHWALMYKHIHETPPKLRRYRPDVDPEIEWVIRKTLAKNPKDRFRTPRGLFETFEDARLGRPGTEKLPRPAAPRKPLRLVALGFVIGLIVLSAGIFLGLLGQPDPAAASLSGKVGSALSQTPTSSLSRTRTRTPRPPSATRVIASPTTRSTPVVWLTPTKTLTPSLTPTPSAAAATLPTGVAGSLIVAVVKPEAVQQKEKYILLQGPDISHPIAIKPNPDAGSAFPVIDKAWNPASGWWYQVTTAEGKTAWVWANYVELTPHDAAVATAVNTPPIPTRAITDPAQYVSFTNNGPNPIDVYADGAYAFSVQPGETKVYGGYSPPDGRRIAVVGKTFSMRDIKTHQTKTVKPRSANSSFSYP
jgi:serine/threonine protein kinase